MIFRDETEDVADAVELELEGGSWGKSELHVSSGVFGESAAGEGGGSIGATLRRFVCDPSDPTGEEE